MAPSMRGVPTGWQSRAEMVASLRSSSPGRQAASGTPGRQPTPAAFGSYSNWAGHAWKPAGMQPTAAFRDKTVKSTLLEPALGDPGAYRPYERSDMAATATATHNIRIASSGARTTPSMSTPTVDLFGFNRKVLREALPQSESQLQGHVHGIGGAAQHDAAGESHTCPAPPQEQNDMDAMRAASEAQKILSSGSGMASRRVDPRRMRDEKYARDLDEKERRWEARHGGRAKSPPPSRRVRRHPRTRDFYGILKVAPAATESEIKSAYHKLARQWHPDRNHDEKAERVFKLIGRAYGVLSDPRTRQAYDRGEYVEDALHAEVAPQPSPRASSHSHS